MTDPLRTAICDRFGLTTPIFVAAMGACTNARLSAAVGEAGGLGTIGVTGQGYDGTARHLSETKALTNRAFGVGLLVAPEFDVEAELRAIEDNPPPVVCFFWGDVETFVPRVHAAGSRVLVQVGSVQEALRAAAAGADIIVAQGFEAGGHVRGTLSTLALVPQVVDAVGDIPVLAAGAISDGRGLAAALCLGAQGAWMGTRFLAAAETDIHPHYRQRVIDAASKDTIHSTIYDIGWADAPARTLRNTTTDEWQAAGQPPSGKRPGEGECVVTRADGYEMRRYQPFVAQASASGDIEAAPLWAGQGVGMVHEIEPASAIVNKISAQARAILSPIGSS